MRNTALNGQGGAAFSVVDTIMNAGVLGMGPTEHLERIVRW
jgi:hypothetical protein